MDKKQFGAWGESVAKTYLENKGYTILETNWRHHHLELDIIAHKDGVVGVEVKTRSNNTDLAFTVLGYKQVNRLRLALKAFCSLRCLNYKNSRLDLVIIKIKNKTTVMVKHHRDI